ncbi:MAG TPA: CAP domain-containing protein [Pyrinomonadaceae bacterium]
MTAPTFASESRRADDIGDRLDQLRANLLNLINEERSVEKVPPVALDDLATRVASSHAEDMAKHEYASHWDRDGLKPYHRYSFAGGVHASQENVSAADNTWTTKTPDLLQDTSYLHVRLYQEKPPNDGHRRAILAPQQTHVGLGIALDKLKLRVVELFVAKHLEVNSIARKVKANDSLTFTAKLTVPNTYLRVIEVFYEPLPQEPNIDWLRQPRSYSLPSESVVLRPKVPPPFLYADGRPGVIEIAKDGTFRVPIPLFKRQPGIYTIVTWLERGSNRKAFPATEVCVRAE